MLRFGCAAASLWLLLVLGGYRHTIFAAPQGRAGEPAAGVCEEPAFADDGRF